MLFITNRIPRQSLRTRIGRNWSFNLDVNAPAKSVFYCRRNREDNYTEIGSRAFFGELKESNYKQILFLIHGFSNLPEPKIFSTVQELQELFDGRKEDEVLVVPLIWPCDNDKGIKGADNYWDDQQSADESAFSFARVLQRFIEWRNELASGDPEDQCRKRINVLAHSMGNRVLRETLAAWNKYYHPEGLPLIFRNTFMVAADVVNESLHKGERGELISHSSRNVVVYFAGDDLALRASKAANVANQIASRRLGHTGPEDIRLTPRNVHQVDCDDVNSVYDSIVGHTYFKSKL